MRTMLCTLVICLTVGAAVFSTRSYVREEGRRTRAAFGRSLDTDVPVDDTQNVIAKKLESIQSQLAALSRRMTVLEESIAARPQVADNTARLQTDLTATRQEVKAIASSQARLSGVPGYLADLTRYLDRSFAHIENRVADSGTPEALLLAVDDLTQRLNVIEIGRHAQYDLRRLARHARRRPNHNTLVGHAVITACRAKRKHPQGHRRFARMDDAT